MSVERSWEDWRNTTNSPPGFEPTLKAAFEAGYEAGALDKQIDLLHGEGATDALERAMKDGSIFGDTR